MRAGSAWNPTPLELVRLPQYCWGQFNEQFRGQPGMVIEGCGGGMNHFCVGLVYLNRAMSAADKSARKDGVVNARREIDYTMARMPPECPIAADVNAARARLEVMEKTIR
jgi:hypothetical protein